jgi:hypothetical protein
MEMYPYSRKPAFFPFVSAEVFFETSETDAIGAEKIVVDNEALDSELDKILGLAENDD